MTQNLTTEGLARWSARRPKTVVAIWLLAMVAAVFAAATLLGDALTDDGELTNNPEAQRAADLLTDRLGEQDDDSAEIIVFTSDTLTVDSPAYQDFVEEILDDAAAHGGDSYHHLVDFYTTGDPTLVSQDRAVTYTFFYIEEESGLISLREAVHEHNDSGDISVYVTGGQSASVEFNEIAEEDLRTGESIGLLAALIILALVFGAIVTAIIPILLAIAAIVVSVGLTALVGQAFDLSFFIVNIITMMGLAVGIDYSLFIVSRYREERGKGLDKHEAMAVAGSTASRAVVFSGLTVVLALVGMVLMPDTVFKSLGTGAILVVITAVVSSLTLLPAVISLLGDKINALRVPFIGKKIDELNDPAESTGFWDRTTRGVMKKPVFSMLAAVVFLGAVATPYLDIETGPSGIETAPESSQARIGFEIVQEKFGFGTDSPAVIVVDGDPTSADVQQAISNLEARLATDDSFGPLQIETHEAENLTVIESRIAGDPVAKSALNSIERLRDEHIPAAFAGTNAEALVTGESAGTYDWVKNTEDYTPIVFIFVLTLSFLLLVLAFRSIVVPTTSIIMNLLSVGAAYGMLVLVFQKGYGADLLGFQQVETIETFLPLFLFSILFGLSMDYHVFLVSRIRERFDQTGDNDEAVAFGLKSTAGLITGAAVIMVAVFGGFALGQMAAMQQMGFGLAVAVFLDATVVRSMLVPSTMKILGRANWYLPSWLEWLPDLRVEGGDESDAPRPELRPALAPFDGD